MALEFKGSPKPTLGVEVEIQLIDKDSKNLSSAAIPLLKAASTIEGLPLKSELNQANVEINTEICQTVRQAGESLLRQLKLLQQLAEEWQLEIAVSGTHPFQSWRDLKIYPDSRYLGILKKFEWLARRLTTYGMHVHVGVRDGNRAIQIMNALINYIPHLLALSASSPFWEGVDTGLASSRVAVLESFPTGGLPYFLPDWKEFEKYYQTLVDNGAIQSIKDIYWDIRPHFDFGTIEVRICDGIPTLKETLALVALVHCLVVWIDRQLESGGRSQQIRMQRYWLAPENKWQAARYGLEGQIVTKDGNEAHSIKEDISKLLETLKPVATSLECAEELSHVENILKRGPSATRQREIFAQKKSPVAVVESLIAELKEDEPSARFFP